MYAIKLNGFGDPEVMEWDEMDDLPAPGPGQVAIDVVAAGVNRADVMQRMGFYPPPTGRQRGTRSRGLRCDCRSRCRSAGLGARR